MQDRPPQGVFVGRAVELAQVMEVIARVEAGQPWLVAIEGDPGVGKTTLARRGLAGAGGVSLRVLSARADQAEADLDFGLADQLLRAAGGISRLVMPAGGTGPAISSFAVGAQLLDVVGDWLATGSLAIFVDDLQWADRKSIGRFCSSRRCRSKVLQACSAEPVVRRRTAGAGLGYQPWQPHAWPSARAHGGGHRPSERVSHQRLRASRAVRVPRRCRHRGACRSRGPAVRGSQRGLRRCVRQAAAPVAGGSGVDRSKSPVSRA